MIGKNTLKLLVLLALLTISIIGPASAADSPQAGAWETWVLESGRQFRLPAPPDRAATAGEIAQLIELADARDDAALEQIAYWNAGPPSYRWNQIAMEELRQVAMPVNMAYRNLALVNVAIYDATIAAWDSKYTYYRARPSIINADLVTVIPNPSSPSYPSEYAVTAGAASAVLGYLFPDKAEYFEAKAQAAAHSRLVAGVEYPSDVEAGLELGRQVAALVIEHAKVDGTSEPWTGSVPTEPGRWTGENPAAPAAANWATWALTSPDEFRPAPPPAFDSEQLAAEMQEVRDFARTPVSNSLAMFWEFGSGGRRIYWFWNDVANRLILQSNLEDNPPAAAQAYALLNTAGHDAGVACWDAKYTYWAVRPHQYDPSFSPLFAVPAHPSYPSAHSCFSSASAHVLAHLFPTDADEVFNLLNEASESRIWSGLHFRSDLVAGNEIGLNVANAVISRTQAR